VSSRESVESLLEICQSFARRPSGIGRCGLRSKKSLVVGAS